MCSPGGISRISALRVASALSAAVVLLVFILGTASVLTLARRSPARAAAVAPLLAPYLEMLLAVVAGFGHMALRPTTGRRNGRI